MLSFETQAIERNAPSPSDHADRPENAIADAACAEHSAKGSSSIFPGRVAVTYRLRGRFAARHTFAVPEELTFRDEPAPMPQLPRWYSLVTFVIISSASIFALCAIGRPGA
ncbi:hypothetical protein [Sphingobium vermicomposti]|uniref:Uncharacterized protein n=1 Tax=Sphingobium vermicomposti TaxID=529005 RepID=A0A846M4F6_9SPHN|nr:hypothetical protein [Sphingobium vermicomposti]NIJ15630.1 hypothetical protein [Sphingobium vermicomposti]